MLLRKLNLAPRSALCFGFFCLMIIALGLIALKQASSLKDSEKFVETNVVPSISLLGVIDRDFVSIRGSNARLRNPVEPAERKAQALRDAQNARANVQASMAKLEPLMFTPMGIKQFGELSQTYASYQRVQDEYLALIASGDVDRAVKLSNEAMKQSADEMESGIKNLIEVNNNKAKKAGEDASLTYEQAKLTIGGFIVFSTLASIVCALMYMRWLFGKDKRPAWVQAEERAFIEAANSFKTLQTTPRGGMRIDPEELRDQILDARERYKIFVQK